MKFKKTHTHARVHTHDSILLLISCFHCLPLHKYFDPTKNSSQKKKFAHSSALNQGCPNVAYSRLFLLKIVKTFKAQT